MGVGGQRHFHLASDIHCKMFGTDTVNILIL